MRDRHVTIYEVGPRDGLQNEKAIISAEDKITFVDMLSNTGLKQLEVASFVSPKWVPQMASSADVMAGIKRHTRTQYVSLAPNMKGYEGAKAANSSAVAVFLSASESFSQKNINCSTAEGLERAKPIFEAAKADGIPVRAYISCVVECPYEGAIAPHVVADLSHQLMALGAYEISLGDTIGKGTPETIAAMLDAVLDVTPADKLAGHYHNTNGRALDNIKTSLDKGIRMFDASVGGLGGCPYAPGAQGNVATEDVLKMLHDDGWETGVDLDAITKAAILAKQLVSGSHAK